MTPRFPVRVVAALAIVIAGGEGWLGWRRGLDELTLVPLAIGTGAFVVVAALAVDALCRRAARPDRADIREVIALQRRIDYRLDATDARLARTDRLLVLLANAPALDAAERDLAAAAGRVERWDDLAADLPTWIAAQERWNSVVAHIDPGLTPQAGLATDEEWRLARERLPATSNFSSQDLKAVTAYYVQSDRLAAARLRLDAYARAAADAVRPAG